MTAPCITCITDSGKDKDGSTESVKVDKARINGCILT